MASIKDVAKKAGVGVGTVSRMINESGYVSEETRAKIELAMQELDYTPNELARNLYRKRSGIIAVLVPNVSYPFFSEFVHATEEELHKAGYKMMLCETSREQSFELEYLDMLRRQIVDGVITGVHTLDIKEYLNMRKPIVAIDRYIGKHIPVVSSDHKAGGRLAAETLIANGCKKVLHFRGSTKIDSPYHERHYEFERVMAENNVETKCYVLEWNRFDEDYRRQVIEEIFENEFDFDGVFGVDMLAIEVMNEAIRRHIKVPKDLKFVSYDGSFVTEIVEPKMTTVVQPVDVLAHECVELLGKLIDGKKYTQKHIMVDVSLRKGNTTIY
jgi:LacI family sucrose operon transcriptional repressor